MHQYRLRERLEHGTATRPWQLYRLSGTPKMVFPCHWHPEWELLLVKRGSLELTRNQTVQKLVAGEVAFVTGTDLHGGTTDDPLLLAQAFVFQPGFLRSERRDAATELWIEPLEAGTLRVESILPAGSPPALVVQRLMDRLERAGPGLELAVKGFLFEFLAAVNDARGIRPSLELAAYDPLPRIRSTLQAIEEQFAEALTVESLASLAHLSSSHFTRLFKSVTGETPIQHLIRRRVDEAARLLSEGEASVTEAALRVGFSNLSHFTQTFRTQRGVNPSEFRRASLAHGQGGRETPRS